MAQEVDVRPLVPARLEMVSGPRAGEIYEFRNGHVTIGREPNNDIAMRDGSVSRNHCRIEFDGREFRLTDLDSRNGTFVNGTPVKVHVLHHEDRLKVGKSIILFRRAVDAVSPEDTTAIGDTSDHTEATIVLRREDAIYLREHKASDLRANERTVRDLDALVTFSQSLGSIRRLSDCHQQIVQSLRAFTPAERIAIGLAEQGTLDPAALFTWTAEHIKRSKFAISQTITQRVLSEGVAVLSSDISEDDVLQSSDSLMAHKVHAVAAIPLVVRENVIGLLYLDTTGAATFDRDLMQLLTAFGAIAAIAVENARQYEWLEGENRRLREEMSLDHNMVGESAAMKDVFQTISRVAPRDATVLITGESGTGKELVARAIHRNSTRADKPFVAINCAAIAENLLESELFGHERGAFTGAIAQKKGKLEIADSGTIFLDEIGELAPALQVKLLRVLQEREFERVGSTRTLRLDIRVIAATNRDLKAESRTGRFREDLYYRLNVVSLRVPALRERREDVPLLASFFAHRASEKTKRALSGISPKAKACLMKYDWPGNVRELENAIERAVVMGVSDLILPEDLPDAIVDRAVADEPAVSPLHEAVLKFKKQTILNALEQADGNGTEAARTLGVHPNHFFRMMKDFGVKSSRRRKSDAG